MSVNRLHYLALDSVKTRLAELDSLLKEYNVQLEEAIKMGDLRENSEYEAARYNIMTLMREYEALSPVLQYPIVQSNDNVSVIEEGCIIDLTVYNVTPTPLTAGSKEFDALKSTVPNFHGVVMYGATLRIYELLRDHALSEQTPVGQFIMGKQPGDYSVPVPAGFANLTVKRLSSGISRSDLFCSMKGERVNG